jgi:prevent-host-death family protein
MGASVTAFDAKSRLGQLLDRVQSGEEITITRHGQPVAMLVPLAARGGDEVAAALETFKSVREAVAKRRSGLTRDEVRQLVNEGRR